MRGRWLTAAVLALLGSGTWCAAQSSEPGIGPALLETKDGQFQGRLLRQDKEMLWVSKAAADGSVFEAGIPLADIKKIRLPTPRVFAAAGVAADEAQIQAVHEALDRLILSLKPFRGLTGIPIDEAILHKGQVFTRQGRWREAIRQFEDILQQPYECEQKAVARLRAGVASELAGDPKAALKYLEGAVLPEDDDELLSTAVFSRATALAAEGRHEDALLDYLRLVVFYPYVQNNELRGLEASVACYAEIEDWESLHKTVQWMQQEFPAARETRHAEEMQEARRLQMEAAGTIMDEEAAAPVEASEPTPAEDSKPAGGTDTEDIKTD